MRTQARRHAVPTARQVDTRRTDFGWDATSTTDPSADIAGTEELRHLDSLRSLRVVRMERRRGRGRLETEEDYTVTPSRGEKLTESLLNQALRSMQIG